MSVLDEIRKLDEQKKQLLQSAKSEALKKAKQAIDELNELGFNYELVERDTGAKPRGTRRTGIRNNVLSVVKSHPQGIRRSDVLDKMNANDKSTQQSVSNALSALKKNNHIVQEGSLYKAVPR